MFGDPGVPVVEKPEALRQREFAGMPDNEWDTAVHRAEHCSAKAAR
jgi:hypothetical protein